MENNKVFENAKEVSWFTDLYTEKEWKTKKTLSLIAAEIELARIKMGKSQKEFAKFMNVSQGMVSRWESGTYNFTIETLSHIAHELNRSIESFFSPVKQLTYAEYVLNPYIVSVRLKEEHSSSSVGKKLFNSAAFSAKLANNISEGLDRSYAEELYA